MKRKVHTESEMVNAVRELESGIDAETVARNHGIRDRYGLILPAEYDWIEHLIPSKPYCKVKKDGHWLIYDIERQELLSEEKFTDVTRCGEFAYRLQSPSGDRYLLIPYLYSRFDDGCAAEIVDQLPSERKDSRIKGRWW